MLDAEVPLLLRSAFRHLARVMRNAGLESQARVAESTKIEPGDRFNCATTSVRKIEVTARMAWGAKWMGLNTVEAEAVVAASYTNALVALAVAFDPTIYVEEMRGIVAMIRRLAGPEASADDRAHGDSE